MAAADATEDMVHTAFASAMGMAFITRIDLRVWGRGRHGQISPLDLVALATSLLVPALMAVRPDFAGLAQRLMFVTACLWFFGEAVSLLTRPNRRLRVERG